MRDYRDAMTAFVDPAIPALPEDLPLNVTNIPKQILTAREIELTERLPEFLLNAVATGQLKSEELTKAFLRRVALASRLVSCVTELLSGRACKRARWLDKYYKCHGKPVGLLHGLPISVKEHITIKGLDLNAGFVGWVGNVAEDDAVILKQLWNAGAVFHVRTTQPQTLMHLETSNNIYSETVNPYNRKLTSGGSSEDEGALIGIKGSCLGIETDIGGSIRNPRANNGLYGFKPTTKRLPNAGCHATILNEEHIVPTNGPMSTSLEGVKIFMKTLIDQQPWRYQSALIPMPWGIDEDLLPKTRCSKTRLKVAIMWDDGTVRRHPPMLRALKLVTKALEQADDVEVVTWMPYQHERAWPIPASLYFADGGEEEQVAIASSGEPMRPLTDFIPTENKYCQEHSITSLWEWTGKRDQYRDEYLKHRNDTATGSDGESEVDVFLCPVGPGPAPPLSHAKYWGYLSQWNLLDYPGLVFPVTQVDPEVDVWEEYEPKNEHEKYNYELYKDPEIYRDAPVSLQLIGQRYEDEKLIQALEFILDRVPELKKNAEGDHDHVISDLVDRSRNEVRSEGSGPLINKRERNQKRSESNDEDNSNNPNAEQHESINDQAPQIEEPIGDQGRSEAEDEEEAENSDDTATQPNKKTSDSGSSYKPSDVSM